MATRGHHAGSATVCSAVVNVVGAISTAAVAVVMAAERQRRQLCPTSPCRLLPVCLLALAVALLVAFQLPSAPNLLNSLATFSRADSTASCPATSLFTLPLTPVESIATSSLDFVIVASQADGPQLVPLFRSLERHVPAAAYQNVIVLHPPADAAYFAAFLPYVQLPLRPVPVPASLPANWAAAAVLQAHKYSNATFIGLLDAAAVFARRFTRDDLLPAAGGMVAHRSDHSAHGQLQPNHMAVWYRQDCHPEHPVDPALVVLPRAWLAADLDAVLDAHNTNDVHDVLANGALTGARNATAALATVLATNSTPTCLAGGSRSVVVLDGYTPANGAFAECLIRAAQPDTCEGPFPPFNPPALVAPPDIANIKARVAAATPVPLPPQMPFAPRSPPVIDFFIRTWYGDGHWLTYALRSIARYVPRGMYRDIVVNYATHEDAYFRSFLPHISDLPIVLVPEDDVYINPNHNGGRYASQIYAKYYPWKVSDADYFIHLDSDTIIAHPVTLADFVGDDGRTFFHARNISTMPDNARIWARAAGELLGHQVEWELMSLVPFVFSRDVYQNTIAHIEAVHGGLPLLDIARNVPKFCEFTTLGAYLVYHMPTRWEQRQLTIARWAWSWGGVAPEVVAYYECMLRAPPGNGACICPHSVWPPEVWTN